MIGCVDTSLYSRTYLQSIYNSCLKLAAFWLDYDCLLVFLLCDWITNESSCTTELSWGSSRVLSLWLREGPNRDQHLQQFLCYSVVIRCGGNLCWFRSSNGLVSTSLHFSLSYPWTRLLSTQLWFVSKNRISVATCFPVRFLATPTCHTIFCRDQENLL
jgi:hypothetical protein